jgi:AraC family transcriptional regulator, arabinose operon regulatory protein
MYERFNMMPDSATDVADKEATQIKAGFLGQRMIIIPENIQETIRRNLLIQKLYITDIGFFPNARNHFRERSTGANEYIIIYCLEGSGIIEVFGQRLELVANSYYILPPREAHYYTAVKDNPWSIFWLHFKGAQAAHFYQKFRDRSGLKIMHVPVNERRLALFSNIIDVLEEGYSTDNIEYVNLSLTELLSSFIYAGFFSEVDAVKEKKSMIDATIGFMRDNLDKVLTVTDLAGQFNYSASHFLRLFKTRTGYTPIHYFNNLKVQKACQLLSFTDMSVKEISYELGFEDPLYFSRLFKKAMAMSPLKYRSEYKD